MRSLRGVWRWLRIGEASRVQWPSCPGTAHTVRVLLLLVAVVHPAGAQYTSNINPDGTLTVRIDCPSGALSIPNTIGGRKVTSIGNRLNVYRECTNLTSVTIPSGVTSIGEAAFVECTALTNVTIPDSVSSIGRTAFYGCSGLTGITIPDSVTNIGSYSFGFCTGLTRITIPSSVSSIGSVAFYRCTSLTNVIIPDSVISIGENAFEACPLGNDVLFNTSRTMLIWVPRAMVGSYSIPPTVTVIGSSAFSDCVGLTSVTIPNSVTNIGNRAFRQCKVLANVTIPESVISIGESVFASCSGLTNITIPNGVVTIGSSAFTDCCRLSSITIPASVTNIGVAPFMALSWDRTCGSGMTAITVDPMNPSYSSLDGVLFNKSQTMLVAYPTGKSISDYTIPTGVTNIWHSAFWGVFRLRKITISASVVSIGDLAFAYCDNLVNLTIPASVTSIGAWAFDNCIPGLGLYLEGDAPSWDRLDQQIQTIRYLPGSKGWDSTFPDRLKTPWVRSTPTILDFGDRFGPSTNGFSFVISWATNVPVVVEASADIGVGWSPISTNRLTEGWVQFTDPEWKSQPARFYRVRGQ